MEDGSKKRQMTERIIQIAKSKSKTLKNDDARMNPIRYSLQKVFAKAGEKYREPSPKELRLMVTNL